jgi:hypothetical protein
MLNLVRERNISSLIKSEYGLHPGYPIEILYHDDAEKVLGESARGIGVFRTKTYDSKAYIIIGEGVFDDFEGFIEPLRAGRAQSVLGYGTLEELSICGLLIWHEGNHIWESLSGIMGRREVEFPQATCGQFAQQLYEISAWASALDSGVSYSGSNYWHSRGIFEAAMTSASYNQPRMFEELRRHFRPDMPYLEMDGRILRFTAPPYSSNAGVEIPDDQNPLLLGYTIALLDKCNQ